MRAPTRLLSMLNEGIWSVCGPAFVAVRDMRTNEVWAWPYLNRGRLRCTGLFPPP